MEVIRCGTCASDRLQVLKTYTNDTRAETVVLCEHGHQTTVNRVLVDRVGTPSHWNTIEAADH